MESGLGVVVFVVAVLVTISGVGAMLLFASDALERWLDAPHTTEPAKERGPGLHPGPHRTDVTHARPGLGG